MTAIQIMMSQIMSRFVQIMQKTAKMGLFQKLRLFS